MRISIILTTILAGLLMVSCDEGDIELNDNTETTGRVVKLTASLSGFDTWNSPYSIVLACFSNDDDYAVQQKPLTFDENGTTATTLTLSSDDVQTIELCVTNRLRQRVISFATLDIGSISGDTIRLDAGTLDIGMYASIQKLVFTNTCARCHGLGNTPAAGLSLAEGKSYANLVNHEAKNPANGMRVVPGDAGNSLLHKVIHGDENSGVPFDHSNMIKESSTINLIDNWIKDGAKP